MYLDNEDFLSWMEKLLKKLTIIGSDLKAMMATRESFNNEDKFLYNQDLAFLLKVSKRSLQYYLNCGKLSFSQINNKCYYKVSDVEKLLKDSSIEKSSKL